MERTEPLVEGIFRRRDNRFRATVEVAGRTAAAHVPNSGRLHELFVPGRRVLLTPRPNPHRRTEYDLVMVEVDGQWVSMDARLPARLFGEAVAAGELEAFRDYTNLRPEVTYDDSRLDWRLEGPTGICYVEVKSVTLVETGTGLFPDAPTERGRRHLRALMDAVAAGMRAAVVFVIQRSDAERFAPNDEADPAFGRTLRQAAAAGVEVLAYRCLVVPETVRITSPVPVWL
ncbi:MAG: DNA/RNA nuclease SfsA [Anaerolineae bacterium]|nr:DNA/RNA nuclease SfsA [Caldilineales bacterium]MDW8269132.1 DNA/RNA nuclease SfsA [Anaerolineae bacterium]